MHLDGLENPSFLITSSRRAFKSTLRIPSLAEKGGKRGCSAERLAELRYLCQTQMTRRTNTTDNFFYR